MKDSDTKRSHNATATKLLDEACRKWPDLPSRTLARKLVEANPLVFASIESARSSITYRRGRNRGHARLHYGSYGKFASNAPRVPHNPFMLPPSDERVFEPYQLNVERDTEVLMISDLHFPYQSNAAITAALQVGRKDDVRLIVLNGDVLDFHQISFFDRTPTAKRVKEEIEICNQFLDALQETFPKARVVFHEGNHEARLDRFVQVKAPELYDLDRITVPQLLQLDERGIDYIGDKRLVMLGKLPVLHGHEFRRGMMAPVNPARGLFLRAKGSAIQGDCHRTSEHNEVSVKRELITTWSVGCLCDLQPKYDPFNAWNHGACRISLAPSGNFKVRNFRIVDGKVMN